MEKITLQNWLANRQRRYADGVALFRSLAPEEMKSKYLSFFSEVSDAPQFDNHYTVLVNKLTSITRMAGARPQMMAVEVAAKTMVTAVAVAKAADAKANEVLGDKVLKEILGNSRFRIRFGRSTRGTTRVAGSFGRTSSGCKDCNLYILAG